MSTASTSVRGEGHDTVEELFRREVQEDGTSRERVIGKAHTNSYTFYEIITDQLASLPNKHEIGQEMLRRWEIEAEEGASKNFYKALLKQFAAGAKPIKCEGESIPPSAPKSEPTPEPALAPCTPPAVVNPFINLGATLKNRAAIAQSAGTVIEAMYRVERRIKDIDWGNHFKKPLPFELELVDVLQQSGMRTAAIIPTICKFMPDGVRLDVKCRVDDEAISKEHCARDENNFILGEKLFTQGTTKDEGESFWLRPVLYEEGRTLRYYGHVYGGSDHAAAAATFVMRNGGIDQIFDPEEWKQIELDREAALKLIHQPTPRKL